MFWETLAALLLLGASFPIWLFVAAIWGALQAGLTLLHFFVLLLKSHNPDILWIAPLQAIVDGWSAAWSIPSAIWTWAKFDHPWWAVIIALLLALAGGSKTR